MHIPKTAGTSLYDWFHEVTGRQGRVGWYDKGTNPPSEFFSNPENRARYYVYGGHFDYGQLKPFLTHKDKVFSVIREPIARAASYHNHVSVRDPNHPLYQDLHGKCIVDAVRSCETIAWELRNHQCCYLSNARSFLETRSVMEEYRPTLYTVNRLDLLTAELARLLGSDHIPKLNYLNVAETDYLRTLSDEDLGYLKEANEEDMKLYEWVLHNEGVQPAHN